MKSFFVAALIYASFIPGAACQSFRVELPKVQKIVFSAQTDDGTGDTVTATAHAVGWRADLTPVGAMTINGVASPFVNIGNGLYRATYIIPDDTTTVATALVNLKLQDSKGRGAGAFGAQTTLNIARQVVAIVRWNDGLPDEVTCRTEGKYYKFYLGEKRGTTAVDYPIVKQTREYAVGDSLQWHLPDLKVGKTYYIRMSEHYPNEVGGGALSNEVGFKVFADRIESL